MGSADIRPTRVPRLPAGRPASSSQLQPQFRAAPAPSRPRIVSGARFGAVSAAPPEKRARNSGSNTQIQPRTSRINQPVSQSVSEPSADRPMDRSAERLDSGLRPGLSGAAPIASRARAGRLPPSAPGSAPSPPLPPSARARRARRGSRGDPKGVGIRVGSSQANIPNQNASVQDVRTCGGVRAFWV